MPDATPKWTPEVLQPYRSKTDPLADELIQHVLSSGEEMAISKLFDNLVQNDDLADVKFPNKVQAYFEETSKLPDWADQNLIKKGEEVFAKYGPEMSMLLLCKSLPEAYVCANGAMVMATTGRMSTHGGNLKMFTRRLMETAQFVVNVASPGGLSPTGKGIVTAQKVRLIHAAIRYYIKKHGWDAETLGEPINQEDMAGTLQSFSTLILEGLPLVGINLTTAEKDAYYHVWRVVGHIIGLEPELNVESAAGGLALGYAIIDHQCKESPQGKDLTKALIEFMEAVIPGNIMDDAPAVIIRYFIGDDYADKLAVPDHDGLMERLIPKLMKVYGHTLQEVEDHSLVMRKLISYLNHLLLQGMLNYFNGDKGVHFYIPPSLQQNWKLKTTWDTAVALSPVILGRRLAVQKKSSTI